MTIEERHMEILKKASSYLRQYANRHTLSEDYKQKISNNINGLNQLYGYLEAINDQKKKRETT